MSWRRGELWFEWEVPWFREVAGAPALRRFAPAPIPSVGPPPGLVASRQRREAWKHRRSARKLRAAVLVVSPAVMFPAAALRSSSGHGTKFMLEDPPSLTFRLGSGEGAAVDRSGSRPAGHDTTGVERGWASVPKPAEVQRRVTRAVVYPAVEWHHATSVGLPYSGSLIDGTQLPIEGPNWVTWDPITDSSPNQPHRLYGNEHTIRTIISVIDAYRAANPDAPKVVVGDISFMGGGPMDDHVSHQNGLDVDIYYPRLDRTLSSPTSPDEIDHRLAQDLLDRFVAAGAQMIFVGFSTGLQGPSGVVIPYPNHENHMHVRFPPPSG